MSFDTGIRLALGALAVLAASCSVFSDDSGLGTGICGESGAAPDVQPQSERAAMFEQRVLELVNERRAAGGCCGGEGCFRSSAPLTLDANLRASARLHARDMSERDYFSHTSPDGRDMVDRTSAAGFGGCALGENIAQGQDDPEAVMQSWMGSDGHCANILLPNFTSLGVGYFDDEAAEQSHLWVQNFGG